MFARKCTTTCIVFFLRPLTAFVVFFMGRWGLTFLWGWTFVAFTAFVAFMRCSGRSFFLALRVFVVFMGHWGWTFVACTMFLLFMECLGWTSVAFMRRSGWSFFVWRLECL